MAVSDFFLDKSKGWYTFSETPGNEVKVFHDNRTFFASVLSDLSRAYDPDHFIYFAGWWSDTYLPLGDPKAKPTPKTLGAILTELAAGRPKGPQPPPPPNQTKPDEFALGPEVCCMLWQHKGQIDLTALSLATLPISIFGAPVLSAINNATVNFVDALRGHNKGILDKAHKLFGSHHQKFIVIHNADGLIAYVGSADFNGDRIFEAGTKLGKYTVGTKGAPLEDVSVRLKGPVASDVLKSFVDRWQLHSDAKEADGTDWKLKGASYTPPNLTAGTITAQVTHTYAKNYPFKDAVRTAADAQLKIIQTARRYLYYEDQYLIGTPELAKALRDKLTQNVEIVVIGVMASSKVADLTWITERRSDFWRQLSLDKPGRVLLFEMLNAAGRDDGPGTYLHNKMTIADDEIATVGTVNFSQRSSTHDSELNVAIGGPASDEEGAKEIALEIRISRWTRHLGRPRAELEALPDGLALWKRLPSNALVRAWTPPVVTWRPPPVNLMVPPKRQYEIFYDQFADPS